VVEDYAATGLSLKAHPVGFFREELARRGIMRNADHHSEAVPPDTMLTVSGLVLTRQMPGAKGVVFVTLEDETGIANIIVWPKVFARHRRVVMTSRFLAVRGRLQRAGLVVHVLAQSFVDLTPELARLADGDLLAHAASDGPAPAAPPNQLTLKSRDFH
jgi:error-prone DNA polymerase